MKKKGYTIAEVLIALAVVGVIAAITIPQVVNHVEKQKIGAQVGRAVEQIELGCQNLIQFYNDKVTDGRYITTLSEIPDELTTNKLAKFFDAIPSDKTFSENDVENYVAYSNILNILSYIMPPAYAKVNASDIGSIDDVRYNLNYFDTPPCASDQYEAEISMRSNDPMNPHNWTGRQVCLDPDVHEKIKNMFYNIPGYAQINTIGEPKENKKGDYSSCEKESEIMVWHMSNGTYKCIPPCTENEEMVWNTHTGYQECKAKSSPQPNKPACQQPNAPECDGELIYDGETCTYTCIPNSKPENHNLFKLNKFSTEIYFVNGINTAVSKPYDVVSRILIDYNGTNNKPNMQGKDIYAFELLNNGKLEAYDDFAKALVKNGFKVK